MPDKDGRKLSHEALEELRTRAVAQVLAGESPEAVISVLGFHRAVIYKWLAMFKSGGWEALKAKPVPGRPPQLDGSQLRHLSDLISTKNPAQLQFEFALWTREMVQELILREYRVWLSVSQVGRILRQMGFTPQRPLHRAYEQDPEKVRRWKEEEYPAIQREAKRVGAEIYFGDESGVRTDYHSGTTWAPKGQTPIVRTTGQRKSVNMISAVSAQGKLRFMTVSGTVNGAKFIEFLKRLLYKGERPIFLIVDGHPAHRAAAVKKFVESTNGRLKLFYLPGYSPQLNPDEWVWKNVKHDRVGRTALMKAIDLAPTVARFMRRLQRRPEVIRAFFRDRNLTYITG